MSEHDPSATEVGIVTTDAGPLVAFYRDAFGMSVVAELAFPQGTVHRLRRGEARVKIFQPAAPAVVAEPRQPWHRDTGMAYAAFHVADVASVVARAEANGATVLVAPTSHRPGAEYALLRDPEGNVWELLRESP